MDDTLTPDDFAGRVIEARAIHQVSAKFFEFDGERVHIDKLFDTAMEDIPLIKDMNPGAVFLQGAERSDYSKRFRKAIIQAVKLEKLGDTAIGSGTYLDLVEYENLLPAIDVPSNEMFMISTLDDSICYEMPFDSWYRILGHKNADLRAEKLSQIVQCIFDYDPYDLKKRSPGGVQVKGVGVLEKFNLYIPPEWRLGKKPDKVKCPALVARLIKHIFPDPEVRRFVCGWMHSAVLKRNDTYLVLNGAKGIGKGVFIETVLKALVGKEHFAKAPVGFLDSNFNSVLENHRVIYLDEQTINTQQKHNMLKDYINPEQNIEAKYQNARKSKETYNSFVISNNSTADMLVKWDDRRFSVMDMTDRDLRESMSDEEIKELTRLLSEDMDYQKQLGHWVLDYCHSKKYTSFDAWRGPAFWKLSVLSLPEWQRFLLELFEENERGSTFTMRSLSAKHKMEYPSSRFGFPRKNKVNEFITDFYLDDSEEPIGSIDVDEEGRWIVTSLIGTDPEPVAEDEFTKNWGEL